MARVIALAQTARQSWQLEAARLPIVYGSTLALIFAERAIPTLF